MSGLTLAERAKAANDALTAAAAADGVTQKSKEDAYVQAVLAHRELHAVYQNRNGTDTPPTPEDLRGLQDLQSGINELGKSLGPNGQGLQDKYDPNEALPSIVKQHLENITEASVQPLQPTQAVSTVEQSAATPDQPPPQPPPPSSAAPAEHVERVTTSSASTETTATSEGDTPEGATAHQMEVAAKKSQNRSILDPLRSRSEDELRNMNDFGDQSAAAVGKLPAFKVAWLGKEQIQDMNAAQVNALCPKRPTYELSDTRSMMWARKIHSLKVEHLSAATVGGIDGRVLYRMNKDQIGKLNASQMTAAQVNALCPERSRLAFSDTRSMVWERKIHSLKVEQLSPEAVAGIEGRVLQRMTKDQIGKLKTSQMTAAQVNSLSPPKLHELNVGDLPPRTVAFISPSVMGMLSKEQIQQLDARQMTAAQVNALSPIKTYYPSNVYKRWFGKGSTQLQALDVSKLKTGVTGQIKSSTLRRMPKEQIRQFSKEQVAEMSAKTLRGFLPMRSQPNPWVRARMRERLQELKMGEVSPEVIPQLGHRFVKRLTVDQVREMTGEQFSAMSGGRFYSQLQAFGTKIAVIKPEEFGKISGRAMSNFSSKQIKFVTEAQTKEMKAEQLEGLARPWPTWKSSIRDLQHVDKIEPEQITHLSGKAIRCFSSEQVKKFTPEQTGALLPMHLNAMSRNCLQALKVQDMSAEAVAGLRLNDRLIGTKTFWNNRETQRLTDKQLKEVLDERTSDLSAKQLNGLWPNQWAMMQPESVGKISPETFAGLSGKALGRLSDQQVFNITPDQIDAMKFGRRYATSGEKVKWLDEAMKKVEGKIESIKSEINKLDPKKPEDQKQIEKLKAEQQRLEGLHKSMKEKHKQVPAPLASRVKSGIAKGGANALRGAREAYKGGLSGAAQGMRGAAKGMRDVIMRRVFGLRKNEPSRELKDAIAGIGNEQTQHNLLKALGMSPESVETMSKSQQKALENNLIAMQNSAVNPESIITALEQRRQENGGGRMGMATMADVIGKEKDNATKQAFVQNGCSEQDARAAAKVAKDQGLDASGLQDPGARAKCIEQIPALQEVPKAQREIVAQALANNVAQTGENGAAPIQQNSRSDLVAVAKAGGGNITSQEQLQNRTAEFTADRRAFRETHGLPPQKAEKAASVMQSPEGRAATRGENPTSRYEDVALAVRQTNSTTTSNSDVAEKAAAEAQRRTAQVAQNQTSDHQKRLKLGGH